MTEKEEPGGGRALVQRLALPVRRAVAPAALELAGQVRWLTDEINSLRSRAEAAEARLAALEARAGELHEGLAEERRLNVRVAELTDLVTELVLPLHDREIDAAALRSLRPEPR
jgi:predicted RNase H-like nuclease (RuvC/YqgF family)